MSGYLDAKAVYANVGVDTDKAIELLKEAAALGNTEAAETLKSLK